MDCTYSIKTSDEKVFYHSDGKEPKPSQIPTIFYELGDKISEMIKSTLGKNESTSNVKDKETIAKDITVSVSEEFKSKSLMKERLHKLGSLTACLGAIILLAATIVGCIVGYFFCAWKGIGIHSGDRWYGPSHYYEMSNPIFKTMAFGLSGLVISLSSLVSSIIWINKAFPVKPEETAKNLPISLDNIKIRIQ
jgi:hypothetical protein